MRAKLERLREVAEALVDGAAVEPAATVAGQSNATPYRLRLPAVGGAYPAFWTRDAAMMLGADLVGVDEVEGWVRLLCSVQAPPDGIRLRNRLFVPGGSIPDHVTLGGAACWYPGAYAGEDQGNGTYGFLPPADNGYYLVQMVRECVRLRRRPSFLTASVDTPFGRVPLWQSCARAFHSVPGDGNGLVVCGDQPGQTRVDWGFCDTVRKTGQALMPSLLRWRAARDLHELYTEAGMPSEADLMAKEAVKSRAAVGRVFLKSSGAQVAYMVSATGQGRREDVWAQAYAVVLGILPRDMEQAVARRLFYLYRSGGTVRGGLVRHIPPSGAGGGFWDESTTQPGFYQNGAWWSVPSGWYIAAMGRVNRAAAEQMLDELLSHIEANRAKGAPWECVNPEEGHLQNPGYVASASLPYAVLLQHLDAPRHA